MRAATARSMEEGMDVALSFSITDLGRAAKSGSSRDTLDAYNELMLQQKALGRTY